MAARLGGTRITNLAWASDRALRVEFTSIFTDRLHQVYAGRSLLRVTDSFDERAIVVQLMPTKWPQEIQIVAVEPSDRLTDFGSSLPDRAYNKAKLRATPSGWTDAKYLEVSAGTEPGGAVDTENVLERVIYDSEREYVYVTPVMEGSGEWNFEVAGIDGTLPEGNRGDALEVSATLLSQPPGPALLDDGSRLEVAVAAGVATVEFSYDW